MTQSFRLGSRRRKTLLGVFCVGVFILAVTFATDPKRAWTNLLIDNVYFASIAVAAGFFLSLQYVTRSGWSEVLRRIPEAVTAFLPVSALGMMLILIGAPNLYHWVEGGAHDVILAQKAPYLNLGFFALRMGVVFAVWIILTSSMRRNSQKEDASGGSKYYRANIRNACLFLVFFGLSFSMTSIDWVMSIDPHWYSTIFGVYAFSGAFVGTLAVITLMVVLLKEDGYLEQVNENHVHDLGKMLFAFATFWAYIWVSQFLLIWYANIPEETVYYHQRMQGDWAWLFYFNLIMNFVIPFFVLLPRASKRSLVVVKRVAIVILIGRWIDLFVMIAPGVMGDQAQIGLPEIGFALGYAALFIVVVAAVLEKSHLVPQHSPYLQESLHHHQ